MRKILLTFAATVFVLGWAATLAFLQTVQAGQASHDVKVDPPENSTTSLPAEPLDCVGTTGAMGCGPGWYYRNGWQGFRCYQC